MSNANPPDEISPAARAEMDAICRRATEGRLGFPSRRRGGAGGAGAGELDPAVREEMYGHLEDKLLAYLRGEERLSEADAMVLVREHFGRPETLRAVLTEVHAGRGDVGDGTAAGGPSLPRKLAAAAVVAAALTLATFLVHAAVVAVPILVLLRQGRWPGGEPAWRDASMVIAHVAANVAVACALYLTFRRWRRQLAAGTKSWFARWRPGAIGALLAALIFAHFVAEHLFFRWGESLPRQTRYHPGLPEAVILPVMVVGVGAVGLQCLAWLWWAAGGRVGRRMVWAACAGAGGWVLLYWAWQVAHVLLRWAADPSRARPYSVWQFFAVNVHATFASVVLGVFLLARFGTALKRPRPPRPALDGAV